MRTIYSNYVRLLSVLIMALTTATLAGCGSGTSDATTGDTSTASISLTATSTSVKSDGSDSVTITATTLTSGNSVIANQLLTFSASTGQISAASGTTDEDGKVTFTFSGGTLGINRSALITVTVAGTSVSNTIPVQITGSTLTLSSPSTSIDAGDPVTLTIVAKNAGSQAVSGQTLRYTLTTGTGTLSAASGTTDGTGTATVAVTGSSDGTLSVLVEWMNGATVSASATQTFAVAGIPGDSLMVTTPATSPFGVSIGTNQSVVVSVPATIGGTTVTNIRYVSTLGSWVGGTAILTVARTGPTDTRTFVPGSNAGNANVQIDALDTNGVVLGSAAIVLAVSSPPANADGITLQSSQAVLPPGGTATLSAFVRDVNNNPVGGANVIFALVTSSGTGETILPALRATDATNTATTQMGRAQAVFTAGSSTTQGATVRATVAGTAITATTPITVGGTAGSLAIGSSTTMTSVNGDTMYRIPVTVTVTDSLGGAKEGAEVSLSIWPQEYYKGTRAADCSPVYMGLPTAFPNEDSNENLILDTSPTTEDIDGPGDLLGTPVLDNKLWPSLASAGSISSSTMTTGADGTATFEWLYLKEYAHWMTVRFRATTEVQGNQSEAVSYIFMKALATDVKEPCPLSASPFN